MRLTFLGTGSAFDPYRSTSSSLIEYKENEEKKSLMFDIGYTIPQSLMRLLDKRGENLTDYPDTILISHPHGDHIGGFPRLVVPSIGAGRTKPLHVIGRSELSTDKYGAHYDPVQHILEHTFHIYYPALYQNALKKFDITYGSIETCKQIGPFGISIAPTQHPVLNYAIRFDYELDGKKKVFALSGDGAINKETEELYKGTDFIVQETLFLDRNEKGHESIANTIVKAKELGIPKVYAVHLLTKELTQTERIKELIEEAAGQGIELIVPNDHDVIDL